MPGGGRPKNDRTHNLASCTLEPRSAAPRPQHRSASVCCDSSTKPTSDSLFRRLWRADRPACFGGSGENRGEACAAVDAVIVLASCLSVESLQCFDIPVHSLKLTTMSMCAYTCVCVCVWSPRCTARPCVRALGGGPRGGGGVVVGSGALHTCATGVCGCPRSCTPRRRMPRVAGRGLRVRSRRRRGRPCAVSSASRRSPPRSPSSARRR